MDPYSIFLDARFRGFLDVVLQEKHGFEIAAAVGQYMLSHGVTPNSHFFSIFCLIFSRDPSLEGYEKVRCLLSTILFILLYNSQTQRGRW